MPGAPLYPMANESLAELRALAKRRQRAVGQKVSRLRRTQQVEIAGTNYDPRRPLGNIDRYNGPQLRAYIRQLDTFMDRRTQYVRGARGSVVTGSAWQAYQRAQRAVSRRNQREFERIADIYVPRFNQTIRERIGMLAAPSRMGTNLASNRPFDPVSKSPRSLMGDRAAKIQTEQMMKRLQPQWIESRIKSDRDTFRKMVETINEPKLADLADKLTPAQFNVFWSYAQGADRLSLYYENMQKMLSGRDEPWHHSTASEAVGDVRDLLGWAGSLNLGR